MGQLRTGNKRRERAIRAEQARKTVAETVPVAKAKTAKPAAKAN